MRNIYHDQLSDLRNSLRPHLPAVSLYIPLVGNDEHPQKIFSSLMKVARNLLLKNGEKIIDIVPPNWEKLRSKGVMTVALFAQENNLHMVPLPTRLQPRVVVAETFHVKPIAAAANDYIESLHLHFHSEGASLFEVTPVSESLIETYLPSAVMKGPEWITNLSRLELRSFLDFLASEVKASIGPNVKNFGVSGGQFREIHSRGAWARVNLPVILTNDPFGKFKPDLGIKLLRDQMSVQISEFHLMMIRNRSEIASHGECLLELSSKILQKKISTLCISLEDMAFGKLDLDSGSVIISSAQMDSRDDDLLDDLLELALDCGISVNVVPRKILPPGKLFIAY